MQPQLKNGRLPEWLGTGLQNRGQRFESATDLTKVRLTRRTFCMPSYKKQSPPFGELCGADETRRLSKTIIVRAKRDKNSREESLDAKNKAHLSVSFAVRTRLELATYGVTGRYSNQLNYRTFAFSTLGLPYDYVVRVSLSGLPLSPKIKIFGGPI